MLSLSCSSEAICGDRGLHRDDAPDAANEQPKTGEPRRPDKKKRTMFFTPDGPGFVRLAVIDAKGAADRVVMRLQ
jgi:hypothetical protein